MNSMKEARPLHVGHRKRLKTRYERAGLLDFADHEILELILFDALPRIDTNPVAHLLLDRFGTLDRVFAASEEELREVKGIGPKTAKRIAELQGNYLQRLLRNCDFSSADLRLSVPVEMHMRYASVGVITLFSRDTAIDYSLSEEDGEWIEVLSRDAAACGSAFAVVVKTDETGISDTLKRELARRGLSPVYCLNDREMELTPLECSELEL